MARLMWLCLLLLTSPALAEPLAGVFVQSDEHMLIELIAMPSGRYALALQMKGDPGTEPTTLTETGEYTYDKKSLALVNDSGEKITYATEKTDAALILKHKTIGTLTLTDEKPLSAQIAARAQAMEAKAKADDDAAKDRIKLGKATPMPDGVDFSDLGKDPTPKQVLAGAEVFTDLHLYVHSPEAHVLTVLDLDHKRSEAPMTYMYFFPNGRFVETKAPDIMATSPKPAPKPIWGAYTVSGDGLTLLLQGKKASAPLLDGRRTIRWDGMRLQIVGAQQSAPAAKPDAKKPEPPPAPSGKAQKTSAEDEMEQMLVEMREQTKKKLGK